MKIVITGSTGFVGKHLVPELIRVGHEILELTRNVTKSEGLFGDSTLKFDLNLEHDLLNAAIKEFEPEVCIHLAAYLTSSDEYYEAKKLISSNISFLINLLDSLKGCKLKLFVNTGTFAEYAKGNNEFVPAYLYAATKTASRSMIDYYSKVYQFKQVNIIPYTIYGGVDSKKKVIDLLFDSLESDSCLEFSPGEQILDFIHIKDVVKFYIQLLERINDLGKKHDFELGTGKGISLRELAQLIEIKSGKIANVNWGGLPYRPADIMYAVAKRQFDVEIDWSHEIDVDLGIELLLKDRIKNS